VFASCSYFHTAIYFLFPPRASRSTITGRAQAIEGPAASLALNISLLFIPDSLRLFSANTQLAQDANTPGLQHLRSLVPRSTLPCPIGPLPLRTTHDPRLETLFASGASIAENLIHRKEAPPPRRADNHCNPRSIESVPGRRKGKGNHSIFLFRRNQKPARSLCVVPPPTPFTFAGRNV
jgi:hypothetical protein